MRNLHLLFLLLFASNWAAAQNFTTSSGYFTFNTNAGPAVFHTFTNVDSALLTDLTVVVDAQGDFGDPGETLTVTGENGYVVGVLGPNGNDCNIPINGTFTLPLDSVLSWIADGSLTFGVTTSFDVDNFCGSDTVNITLSGDTCSFGMPVAFANLAASALAVCPDEVVVLTATPSGGTLTGMGLMGSMFSASALPEGSYTVTYAYTDAIGCVTTDKVTINVKPHAFASDREVCRNANDTLREASNRAFNLFTTPTGGTPVATNLLAYPYVGTASTTWYLELADTLKSFVLDSLGTANSLVIDHNAETGDDRGGVIVTPNYVYVIGDDAIARYDPDLLTAATTFPVNDGLFSDLKTGSIYEVFDGTSSAMNYPSPYVVTQLRHLDADLMPLNTITLSQSIDMSYVGNYNNGIYAGYGFVILYSDFNNALYRIDLPTGVVTPLATGVLVEHYFGENWADWGVAEFDGSDYYICFRDYNDEHIVRWNANTGVLVDTVASFPFLSDLASFSFSPWNNRWYFHHEGGSSFGGSSETFGYADAAATITGLTPLPADCRAGVNITVPTVSISPGADTACVAQALDYTATPATLVTYSWNGNNSDLPTYSTSIDGPVVLVATTAGGCVLRDTALAVFESVATPSVQVGAGNVLTSSVTAASYQWYNVTTGTAVPVSGATQQSFTPSASGDYFVVAITGAGCESENSDTVSVVSRLQQLGLNGFALYPNPANSLVTVQLASQSAQRLQLQVLNTAGQVVWAQELSLPAGPSSFGLPTAQLAPGVYVLNLSSALGSASQRLVVQH